MCKCVICQCAFCCHTDVTRVNEVIVTRIAKFKLLCNDTLSYGSIKIEFHGTCFALSLYLDESSSFCLLYNLGGF